MGERLVPFELSPSRCYLNGVLIGTSPREPIMVPESLLAEAQAIRDAARSIWAQVAEDVPHDKLATELCTLLDRLDAAAERVPGSDRFGIEQGTWAEELQIPIFDLLAIKFDADADEWIWCIGDREVYLSCHGDRWAWLDDAMI